LREQCNALQGLLIVKEEEAREKWVHLCGCNQESERLWLLVSRLQEELDRLAQGMEPTVFATPAASSASLAFANSANPAAPLQEDHWSSNTPASATAAAALLGLEETSGRQVSGPASELLDPGTPSSRHVLSLLSLTPGPTMGIYADTPLLPALEASGTWQPQSPAPTQAPMLPSPSGRLVPSPPRHPAPVPDLLSPERGTGGPPERDATEGAELVSGEIKGESGA
jgi:hypothetical protein